MKIKFIQPKNLPSSWGIPQNTPTKFIAALYEDDDIENKYPVFEDIRPEETKSEYCARIVDLYDNAPFVFVVMRNSDFTEGRGGMLLDSVFASRVKAEEYVASKPGVMGSKSYRDAVFNTRSTDNTVYCFIMYNGYDIRKIPLQ